MSSSKINVTATVRASTHSSNKIALTLREIESIISLTAVRRATAPRLDSADNRFCTHPSFTPNAVNQIKK
jgi:hypothetical protein